MSQLKIANMHTARELMIQFEPSDEALPLLDERLSALDLVNRLVENSCYADAVKCVALLLPNREAVWWACLAVKDSWLKPSRGEQLAIESAERWAIKPSEQSRQQAQQAAEKIGNSKAAAWPAMAVGWSGGSMAEPGQENIAPPSTLYAHAAACAVMLSSATDPSEIDNRCQQFIRQGLDMADGGKGNK